MNWTPCLSLVLAVGAALSLAGTATAEPDSNKPSDDEMKAILRVMEASAENDPYGPMIAVPDAWRRCKAASDCEVVYSSCGAANAAVNKSAKKKAEAAWKKRCLAANRVPMGLLTSRPELTCEAQRCGTRMHFGGLGGLGGAFSGASPNKPATRARKPPSTVVRISQVKTKGGLHKDMVRRVLRQRRNQLLFCYKKTQVERPVPVKMKLQAEVSAKGRVMRVSASAGPKGLRPCITRVVRRFRFAAPKKDEAEFDVTIHFEPATSLVAPPNSERDASSVPVPPAPPDPYPPPRAWPVPVPPAKQ